MVDNYNCVNMISQYLSIIHLMFLHFKTFYLIEL